MIEVANHGCHLSSEIHREIPVVTTEQVPKMVELKTEVVVIEQKEVVKEVPVIQIVKELERVEVQGATLSPVVVSMNDLYDMI